jgi:Flp pilus assembly protein TadD
MMFVGYAKLLLNADEEATMWLRRSIETNRNYPLPHFLLTSALARLGHLDQARAAVRGGLAVDPHDPPVSHEPIEQ